METVAERTAGAALQPNSLQLVKLRCTLTMNGSGIGGLAVQLCMRQGPHARLGSRFVAAMLRSVRRNSHDSVSSTPVQFRVNSVVIRCALPLPRRAAYGAVPLRNVMATPGHFLLNRSFPVNN